MKKTTAFGLTALLVIVLGVGFVSAFGQGTGVRATNTDFEQGTYHEQMEEIVESGTYEDLEDLRVDLDMNMMPRVQSQEDFEVLQLRHAEMEQYWEEQGIEPEDRGMGHMGQLRGSGIGNGMGNGMHGQGNGQGFEGGCSLI